MWDVVDYVADSPRGWIVAVSTLEHVGWDEDPREPAKLTTAVAHLRDQLASDGRMLITAPRGYNPFLDEAIASGSLAPTHESFLTRSGPGGAWREHSRDEALATPARYDLKDCNAYDLWVAEFAPISCR